VLLLVVVVGVGARHITGIIITTAAAAARGIQVALLLLWVGAWMLRRELCRAGLPGFCGTVYCSSLAAEWRTYIRCAGQQANSTSHRTVWVKRINTAFAMTI
jgi:hypothetical protein